MRPYFFILAGLAIAVVVFVLSLDRLETPADVPLAHVVNASDFGQIDSSAGREAFKSDQVESTVGEFLSEYWGTEWESVKERYVDRHVSLSAAWSSMLLPWDEVEKRIDAKAEEYFHRDKGVLAKLFRRRIEDNLDQLRGRFGIADDLDLAPFIPQLKAELADIEYELDLLLPSYLRGMEQAFRAARDRGPDRLPLLQQGQEHGPDAFWRIYVDEAGWHAVYKLSYSDSPDLAEIYQRRTELVSSQSRVVRKFFQALR